MTITAATFDNDNSIHQQQEEVPCVLVIFFLTGWMTCVAAINDNNHSCLRQ